MPRPIPVVLVTGATGFVGSALVPHIPLDRFSARVSLRSKGFALPDCVELAWGGELGPNTNWDGALSGASIVVHAAARVHIMAEIINDPLDKFRYSNVAGTLNLARQAVRAGVKRFVFLSSIKVNGDETQIGQRYGPSDTPKPSDPYAISKCEAEEGLRRIADETGLEVVIIRPVLVYGPGVKGNFLSMMHWVHKGAPLPLGAIHNLRSLVALDNLIDLIVTCLCHPAAANQTFLVSDDEDISTTDLLRRTATAMGKTARLIPVPAHVLRAGVKLIGKRDIAQRLCGSLQVDITKTRELLGWSPPIAVDQGLQRTVDYFLAHQVG